MNIITSRKAVCTSVQHDMTLLRELRGQIRNAGCMKPAPIAIGIHMIITLGTYFGAFAVLLSNPDWGVRILVLVAVQVMLLLHFVLWFGPPVLMLGFVDAALNFVLAGWLMGPYLGCVILLNHIGTKHLPASHGMSHFRRAILTTRNFGSGRIGDYLTGGTNNHLEHHLFPTIPICRLGEARRITRNFCTENELPYRETSWLAAQKETLAHLAEMSTYARTVWNEQALVVQQGRFDGLLIGE